VTECVKGEWMCENRSFKSLSCSFYRSPALQRRWCGGPNLCWSSSVSKRGRLFFCAPGFACLAGEIQLKPPSVSSMKCYVYLRYRATVAQQLNRPWWEHSREVSFSPWEHIFKIQIRSRTCFPVLSLRHSVHCGRFSVFIYDLQSFRCSMKMHIAKWIR